MPQLLKPTRRNRRSPATKGGPCSPQLQAARAHVAPQIVAWQVPLSVGFSRQEHWSRLSLPTSGELLTQGSNPHLLCLLHWQVGSWAVALSRKLHAWLVENKLRRQSLWKSLVVPQKVKHRITIWPSNSTHNYIPKRNENICLHKKLNNFKISPFIKPK